MTSSKRSSQLQRDLELSRLKREELEKHETKLRIARQRLEIEKQTKLRELEIEELEEDHREEVAAAAPEEIELMTKSSADGSGTCKLSGLFTERSSVKSKKLVQDWVNSSPAGNMADIANEPSLPLFWFHRPIQPRNWPTTFFNSTSKLTLQSQNTWSS